MNIKEKSHLSFGDLLWFCPLGNQWSPSCICFVESQSTRLYRQSSSVCIGAAVPLRHTMGKAVQMGKTVMLSLCFTSVKNWRYVSF